MGNKVLGITGVSGCGKTTISKLLSDRHGFHRLHFPFLFPAWLARRLLLNPKVPTSVELGTFMVDRALGMLVGNRRALSQNVVLDRWWFDACLNVAPEESELLRKWYLRYSRTPLFNPDKFLGVLLVASHEDLVGRKTKYSPPELRRQCEMFELGYQVLSDEGLTLPVKVDASRDPLLIANQLLDALRLL